MPPARVSHGRVTRTMTVGGFTITDAVYAPNQRVARHGHGSPSWTLVLAGALEERFSRETLHAVPGTVLTKPARADHANAYGPAGARCLLIGMQDDDEPFDVPRVHDAGTVPWLARRIHETLMIGDRVSRISLEALLIELGAATRPARRFPRVHGKQAWLNDVREQLEVEFRAPPVLAELARAHGVHPTYLCQAFHARFGVSTGQFVRTVRFEWARDALRAGAGGSLADIAAAAGYCDQPHFTRDFRRRADTSPRRFRAAMSRTTHFHP